MKSDSKRIREVYERALDLDPRGRAAFLDETCAGDPALRREVESLLRGKRAGRPHAGAAVAPTEIFGRERAEAADEPPDRLRVGAVVDGKYRIDGLLGEGGMGAVYRATHLRLERAVALKAIRDEMLADATAAERFRREAVAVARLRHPNIVTVHDYGVAPDAGAYLVMELLEGRSLRAELRERKRLDLASALAIAAEICSAVAAAHDAGVVHRDLKPENVLLERMGDRDSVKVVDFGLARLGAGFQSMSHALTQGGEVLGTPGYMSPEQCRGEEADARSDVYAIGCLLFEMLTGERPFKGRTAWAVVYQHVNEPPPRPSERVAGLPAAIDDAILGALAKSPDERWQTPAALLEALGLPDVEAITGFGATDSGIRRATGDVPLAPTGEAPVVTRAAGNLPHAVTRFVGREREIEEVRGWLERSRLVTLVGPGGIGKTRLALEVAGRSADGYRDGVWLVELASLADPALLAHAIGAALGMREGENRSETGALEAWLGDKEALVVLDNCEHMVAACAELVGRLLGACAKLRILATSRESLAVAGEVAWPVPALVLSPSDAEGADEAVCLFVDRAALAKPGFEVTEAIAPTVAELVRRLEGVPLAIELAAARVKALTVAQILARLDDRFRLLAGGSRTAPTRQQALQATMDWSYDLLTEEERTLFRRLSVFAGGWTLDAAEEVCTRAPEGAEPLSALDLISRLADKSLVTLQERPGEARYGMLEMIREYASDLLARAGEEPAIRRRHADYFLALGERARETIRSTSSVEWLDRMDEEHDNVRVAFAWLLEHDPEGALALAGTANIFRALRGHLAESRRSLETAIAASPTAPAQARAYALGAIGNCASTQGDNPAARRAYEEALALSNETESAKQIANLTFYLGALDNVEGDLDSARRRLEESLAIGRQMGYPDVVRVSLNSLGEVARLAGDADAARSLYEQSVELARQSGHEDLLVIALCNLGAVACESGDAETARGRYEEALTRARALGSTEIVSFALDGLAAVATMRGAWARAGRLAGAAAARLETSGAALPPVDLAFRERYLRKVREQLGEEGLVRALAEGRALTAERAIEEALTP